MNEGLIASLVSILSVAIALWAIDYYQKKDSK